jgi:hypothetical protein
MTECRCCGSRDLAPVLGGSAFVFCRRCLLVQRAAAPAPGRLSASAAGSIDRLVERHHLGPASFVVGVDAAPLLERNAARDIPVLAVEQDGAAAAAGRAAGLPVVEAPFGLELAEALAASGRGADLVVAPGFGRLADPAGAAAALARLVAGDGAAELAFASAAEIVPLAAWAAADAEATLPTLHVLQAVLEAEGLYLNDAGRAGRHHLVRASASTERRSTQRLVGLLEEERRLGADSAGFYSGDAPNFSGRRRSATDVEAGAIP